MRLRWTAGPVLVLVSGCQVVPMATVCERQPELCDEGTVEDADSDGYIDSALGGDDCDDADAAVHPGADERCDGVDSDCDGVTDEEPTDGQTLYADADEDGYGDPESATVRCEAGDGWVSDEGDCNDEDPSIHPGQLERCDTGDVDEDCDGFVDDDDTGLDPETAGTFYVDADEDGFGDASTATAACDPPSGTITEGGDCDDADEGINPAATEVCDAEDVDEDCDDLADDADESVDTGTFSTFWVDDDGDGYGQDEETWTGCDAPSGYATTDGDCDDGDTGVFPGATEVCDGVDNDCDDLADDGDDSLDTGTWTTFYGDDDGDGYGEDADVVRACEAPSGTVLLSADCDDADASINPAATEVCDTGDVDEDCNGLADDEDTGVDPGTLSEFYADDDGDGFGDATDSTATCDAPSGYVTDASDCDDGDTGITDGDDYYADADGDGYGDPDTTLRSCSQPSGYVADDTDCDDGDTGIHPGIAEVDCDGVDNDCDGRDGDLEVGVDATTIGATLALASSGDEVCVPAGTYAEQVTLIDGVRLVGVDGASVTTIDGTGSGPVLTADGVGGEVEGFTLTGGTASQGAGVFVRSDDVALSALVITGNSCDTAQPGGWGAGLYVLGTSSVSDVLVEDNTCEPATIFGGAAWLTGASVEDLEVRDNLISGTQVSGGALYLDNVDAQRVWVVGNDIEATNNVSGASLLSTSSELVALGLVDNTVVAGGVGAHLAASASTVTNAIIAGNTCEATGTVSGCGVQLSEAELVNAAIVGNQSTGGTLHGTGVYMESTESAPSTLLNTVVAASSATATTTEAGTALYLSGDATTATVRHSDFYDNGTSAFDGLTPDSAGGNLFVDPDFVDTTASDAESWDLTLDTGSPLIDAGDTGLLDPDGSVSDIGAYGGPQGSW